MKRNLLVECDAGQERGILLSWMSHEDEVDVGEGSRLDQVDFSSYILLCRCSQNSYLVESSSQSFDINHACTSTFWFKGDSSLETVVLTKKNKTKLLINRYISVI